MARQPTSVVCAAGSTPIPIDILPSLKGREFLLVPRQSGPCELPETAGFLAIRYQLELEALPSQHNAIILLVYATVK
jgi:hypothetical protein